MNVHTSINDLSPFWDSVPWFSWQGEMKNGQLTVGFNRPASLRIPEISHEYALSSVQPVASSLPSVENDTH